jgi:hypothetical protein
VRENICAPRSQAPRAHAGRPRSARGLPGTLSPGSQLARTRPACDADRALAMSSEHVLQDRLVGAQVGDSHFNLALSSSRRPSACAPPTCPSIRTHFSADRTSARTRRSCGRSPRSSDGPLPRQDLSDLLIQRTLLIHMSLQATWRPKSPKRVAADSSQESEGRPAGKPSPATSRYTSAYMAATALAE